MRGGRDKLKAEIKQKETRPLVFGYLDVLGYFQPMQFAKGTKMRRFTVKTFCSSEKINNVTG